MTSVVTPSTPITQGQIGKLQDLLSARLRKSGLSSDPVQQVLETQGDVVADEMLTVIRKHVESVSSMIVRHVKVSRTCTPQEALDATGRKQYVDNGVVKAMPRGDKDEDDVHFFKPEQSAYDKNGWISDDNLEKQFDLRGLKPVDPYKLAQVNIDDPAFGDKYPNATHWKNAEGKWCFAAFDRWSGERGVSVYRGDGDWSGDWWFAGVCK